MAERELKVKFTGDTKGLEKSLTGAQKAVKTTGDKISKAGAILAGGAAAGLAAGVAFAKKSVDTYKNVGGEILKLQRYTGASAEDASRMRAEFKLTGMDTDKAARSFGIFSKNLAAGKLDKLGVQLKDAHGKLLPFNDMIGKVADKISKMPPGVDRTALAMKFFGKSGADMLPFLSKGSEGLAELAKKSDELGTTMSGKDLDAIKESKKQSRLWSLAMEGLQIQIGRYVLPVLTAIVTWINTKGLPAFKRLIDRIQLWLIPQLGKLSAWWKDEGKAAWEDFVQWVEQKLLPVLETLSKDILEKVIGAFKIMIQFFKDHPDWAAPVIAGFAAIIAMIKLTNLTFVSTPWGAFFTALLALGTGLYVLYKTNQDFAFQVDKHLWEIKQGWAQFAGWLQPVVDTIKAKWDQLSQGIATSSAEIAGLIHWLGSVYDWLKGPVGATVGWIQAQWARMVADAQAGYAEILVVVHLLAAAYNWVRTAVGTVAGWIAGQWARMVADARAGYAQIVAVIHALGAAYSWLMTPVRAAARYLADQWDRMVRDAKEGAEKIKGYLDKVQDAGNWLARHNPLQIPTPGLPFVNMVTPPPPALAAGGIVRGTPHGTLVRAGEGGRSEAVVPLSRLFGGGGSANNYNINVKVEPGADPVRAGAAVVDAIRSYERVNGQGWRTVPA